MEQLDRLYHVLKYGVYTAQRARLLPIIPFSDAFDVKDMPALEYSNSLPR